MFWIVWLTHFARAIDGNICKMGCFVCNSPNNFYDLECLSIAKLKPFYAVLHSMHRRIVFEVSSRSRVKAENQIRPHVGLIMIMLAYLYCAAYTRMTMNESSPLHEQRRITFNDDGQRVQLARPELPAPHYICIYRLLPTTPPITV